MLGCVLLGPATATGKNRAPTGSKTDTGEFTFLTYNIAGLPALFSRSDPERNIPLISDLLNLYDVAVVQEDFVYHDSLVRSAHHPHRSWPLPPGSAAGFGDGLNTFSRIPFTGFSRVSWQKCNGRLSNGSDCLTAKGFTVAEHHVAPGVAIDVYNVHMDSGGSAEDAAARRAQADQLLQTLAQHSAGKPVIVAGDTNLGASDEAVVSMVLEQAHLLDSCRVLSCRSPHLIDRVMYRGTKTVDLTALQFELDPRFVRDDGRDLSDHKAVGVLFRWSRISNK